MKIRIEVDGEEKKVELPFWQGFKVWILCYLGLVGMMFGLGFLLGILSGIFGA